MKTSFRVLALLLALLMAVTCALAETADDTAADTTATAEEDYVIATVNGEDLYNSTYTQYLNTYTYYYQYYGYDTTDETVASYLEDSAFSAAVEEMLIEQDMRAQGCYDFDEETEAAIESMGQTYYEQALADVGESLRSQLGYDETVDMSEYALAYAETIGVTAQDYIDYVSQQYAYVNYYSWLMQDDPITEEDIQTAYAQDVASSQELYENDVSAFETAVYNNEELWYKPAGYRSILQILLQATGDTDEEKLASVQDTVNEIYARLEAGESFESLIREYGTDSSFDEESFFTTGYQVHRDSVIWEDAFVAAAFGDDMQQPGDYTHTPLVSDVGVHILYYLCDSTSGPVEMTDEIHDALEYDLYSDRAQEKLEARMDVLAESAVIEYK